MKGFGVKGFFRAAIRASVKRFCFAEPKLLQGSFMECF